MAIIRQLTAIMFGFASGVVTAGATFAFIAIIGVVPRMAEKTKTTSRIMLYEEFIISGGIVGTLLSFTGFYLPIGSVLTVILSFCSGVFFGALAMALAEVLDVIPVLTRRGRLQRGIYYFVLAIAAGKLIGSLMYYIIPGFFSD